MAENIKLLEYVQKDIDEYREKNRKEINERIERINSKR